MADHHSSAGRGGPVEGTTRFLIWGCRGSAPAPGPQTSHYGGDTTCFEIRGPQDAALLIDGGTGLRRLGAQWSDRAIKPDMLDMLLSHLHLDHVSGLTAFMPLMEGEVGLRIWTTGDARRVADALRRLLAPPFMPIDVFAEKRVTVVDLPSTQTRIGPFEINAFPLNHPGGATGFSVGCSDKRVVVVCDHEHGDPAIDAGVAHAAQGADLLVYDAPFDEAQYAPKRGWGHSTYEAGCALAEKAGAARLLMVHHQPSATDADLDRVAAALARSAPYARLGRDGDRIDL